MENILECNSFFFVIEELFIYVVVILVFLIYEVLYNYVIFIIGLICIYNFRMY